MTMMTDLSKLYDEPLDPESIDFTTKPGTKCEACLFARQRVAVCNAVEAIARREGLDRCDSMPVVYVRRETDPRQITIYAAHVAKDRPT